MIRHERDARASGGNKYKKYQCPCCRYYTFIEKPDNTFETCPVCFWEDDGIQLRKLYYEGGANVMSLHQAQRNYQNFGAIDLKYIKEVRSPLKDELKD